MASLFSRWFGLRHARRTVPLSPEQQQRLDAWRKLTPANLQARHEECRYVIVDVESSGLNMAKDRLISIGAVALVGGRIDFSDAFQVVLRQDQVSSHENILIHGIGGSTQSEGVEPAEALLSFLHYIGKDPLVAYHAFFDQAMIDKAMLEYLGCQLGQPWIDLAWVLPDFFPHWNDNRVSLDSWLEVFAIENISRHNAVFDAYATAKLLQVAIAHGNGKGASSPARFIGIEKARRWLYESR